MPGGMDPTGNTYKETIKHDTVANIISVYGNLAYTGGFSITKNPGEAKPRRYIGIDRIEQSEDKKCAWVVSAPSLIVRVLTVLPIDSVPLGYSTFNGLREITGHERRRRKVYKLANKAYLEPNEKQAKNVTRCGVVKRDVPGEAKRLLEKYLHDLREKAFLKFKSYSFIQQSEIAKESDTWVDINGNPLKKGSARHRYTKIHTVADPLPFEPVDCP